MALLIIIWSVIAGVFGVLFVAGYINDVRKAKTRTVKKSLTVHDL